MQVWLKQHIPLIFPFPADAGTFKGVVFWALGTFPPSVHLNPAHSCPPAGRPGGLHWAHPLLLLLGQVSGNDSNWNLIYISIFFVWSFVFFPFRISFFSVSFKILVCFFYHNFFIIFPTLWVCRYEAVSIAITELPFHLLTTTLSKCMSMCLTVCRINRQYISQSVFIRL